MADIFISYSQKDRHVAEELSQFLDQCGYSVWWDYELVGGAQFRKEIEAQLDAAKAAIVIWTENSVESGFVLDEAQVAQSLGKLLPTRVASLDHKFIPLGFKQFQTDLVTKPDLILRSLEEKFGVGPSKPPVSQRPTEPVAIGGGTVDSAAIAAADQFANWEFIKGSTAPGDFRGYISRFPTSPLAELARARLGALEDEAWSAASRSGDIETLRRFLESYPGGRHERAVRYALESEERKEWVAVDKQDAASLRAFLTRFPDGPLADDVRFRLAELDKRDAERAVWTAFERAPSRAGLEDYVSRFPFGAHVDDAKGRLASLIKDERRASAWAKIKETGFSEQLRAFIEEFGSGPEVDEARGRLAKRLREKEEAAWPTVKDARHPADVLRFLREFPLGARSSEAKALLKQLPAKIEKEAWEVVAGSTDATLHEAFLLAYPNGGFASEARRGAGKAAEPAQARAQSDVVAGRSQSTRLGRFGRGLFLLLAAGGYIGSLVFAGFLLENGAPYEGMAIGVALGMLSALVLARALWVIVRRSAWADGVGEAYKSALKYVIWCAPAAIWYGVLQALYKYTYWTSRACPCPISSDDGGMVLVVVLIAALLVLFLGWLAGKTGHNWLLYVVPLLVGAGAGIAVAVGFVRTDGYYHYRFGSPMSEDAILYGATLILVSTLLWIWGRWRG